MSDTKVQIYRDVVEAVRKHYSVNNGWTMGLIIDTPSVHKRSLSRPCNWLPLRIQCELELVQGTATNFNITDFHLTSELVLSEF